jgi:hypothetical protein
MDFDPDLHVSWPALRYYNEAVEAAAIELSEAGFSDRSERWLFSFMGSASDPLRKALLDLPHVAASGGYVKEVNRWYDHSASEKRAYVDVLLNTTFVLCPRGVAPYCHRILEALALGNVPVILADDWVPFSVDASDYYVRIPERRAHLVADILRFDDASVARQLKATAQDVYRRHFDVRSRFVLAIERLLALHRSSLQSLTRQQLVSRWHSQGFRRSNGWCLDQRLIRRLTHFAGLR